MASALLQTWRTKVNRRNIDDPHQQDYEDQYAGKIDMNVDSFQENRMASGTNVTETAMEKARASNFSLKILIETSPGHQNLLAQAFNAGFADGAQYGLEHACKVLRA